MYRSKSMFALLDLALFKFKKTFVIDSIIIYYSFELSTVFENLNLKAWSHECCIVPHRSTHEKRMTFNA